MISIIIPVYNAEKTIHRCIRSVCSQTYKDWELILVNDGSKDNSGKICDEYSKQDKRIHVIHKENEGVSKARNAGLKIATGDYISFVDSDDWLDNNYLQNFMPYTEYDIVISAFHRRPKHHIAYSFNESFKGEEMKGYLIQPYLWNGYPWGKLFKRSIIEKHHIRFDEGMKVYEDLCFCLQYTQYCNSVRLIPAATYNYYEANDKCFAEKFPLSFEEAKRYFNNTYNSVEALCQKWNCDAPDLELNYLVHCGYHHILDNQSDKDFLQAYMEMYPNANEDKFYSTKYLSPVYYCVEQVLKEYKYKEYRKAIKHAKALVKIYGDKLDSVNLRKGKDKLYLKLIKNKMFKLVIVAAAILDCNKF